MFVSADDLKLKIQSGRVINFTSSLPHIHGEIFYTETPGLSRNLPLVLKTCGKFRSFSGVSVSNEIQKENVLTLLIFSSLSVIM